MEHGLFAEKQALVNAVLGRVAEIAGFGSGLGVFALGCNVALVKAVKGIKKVEPPLFESEV